MRLASFGNEEQIFLAVRFVMINHVPKALDLADFLELEVIDVEALEKG
jgi:hypothetical protein